MSIGDGGKPDRYDVAWLIWCWKEGYVKPEDREGLQNWIRDNKDLLHWRDSIDREVCLAIADMAIEVTTERMKTTVAGPRDIVKRFTAFPPRKDQPFRYAQIREMGMQFASLVAREVPASREQKLALEKIEEAVMWANKGIAQNEQEGGS